MKHTGTCLIRYSRYSRLWFRKLVCFFVSHEPAQIFSGIALDHCTNTDKQSHRWALGSGGYIWAQLTSTAALLIIDHNSWKDSSSNGYAMFDQVLRIQS